MTGLETILISAGATSVGIFGTFLSTARYYQKKVETVVATVVTREQCAKCRELCGKDALRRDDAVEEVVRQVESLGGKLETLAAKYDKILKILILNINIPNDLKKEILP